MLHGKYAELLDWNEHAAESFEKPEVCEFCANIAMYTHKQYEKRVARGRKLDRDNIDKKLKQSHRRKRFVEFFAGLFGKRKKNNG